MSFLQLANRPRVSGILARGRNLAPPLLMFLVVACNSGGQEAGPQGGAPNAMPVSTMTASYEAIDLSASLQGRTTPYAVSEIRPQVSGLIEKRLFEEGQAVKAGDPLYQIEDSEYRAAVESATASLSRARANANVAQETANRLKGLVDMDAVSSQQFDEAAAAAAQASADVAMARAALNQANINLERTTIRAPIDGKIGRSSVTPGALVTQNQAGALATIRQLDPLYVDLTAAATDVIRWKRGRAADFGGSSSPADVTVSLEDGSVYEHPGQLAFSEVGVDQTSGTVVLRAIVPNPDGYLLPGMFVRASLPVDHIDQAILVPQSAVMRTPSAEPYVLIIGENGTAQQRILTIEQARAGDWIVTDGIEPGAKVITSALQMVRPGMPVMPKPDGTGAQDVSAANTENKEAL